MLGLERRACLVGAVAMVLVSAWLLKPVAIAQTTDQTAPPKLTFEGDVALWSVAIKPDKTADFERIIAKLREGLSKSENLDRRKQLAGWKLVKIEKPLPDGNLAYVHLIDPVVRGADYTVMQILYDEFPDERQALYELYRGALAQNLSLAVGSVVGNGPATP